MTNSLPAAPLLLRPCFFFAFSAIKQTLLRSLLTEVRAFIFDLHIMASKKLIYSANFSSFFFLPNISIKSAGLTGFLVDVLWKHWGAKIRGAGGDQWCDESFYKPRGASLHASCQLPDQLVASVTAVKLLSSDSNSSKMNKKLENSKPGEWTRKYKIRTEFGTKQKKNSGADGVGHNQRQTQTQAKK